MILSALTRFRCRLDGHFDWSICEDETVTNIATIAGTIARPIRTLISIPEDIDSESELLDWLIHGDKQFSEMYVVMELIHWNKGGPDLSSEYTGTVVYEISESKYGYFWNAAQKAKECSWADRCMVYIHDVDLLDRGTFLPRFGGMLRKNPIAVDDDVLEDMEEAAGNDRWADEKRLLPHCSDVNVL